MTTDFDCFSNRGEYFSAHYFAEQLGADLKKGLFATWALREGDEKDERATSRELVRALRGQYLTEEVRSYFAECAREDADRREFAELLRAYGNQEWAKRLGEWHQQVLHALGYTDGGPTELMVHRAGREHTVQVAYSGHGVVALDCGWAADNDSALDAAGAGRLLTPVRVTASEAYETGAQLASWLFHSELGQPGGQPPRFVLLLVGGVIVLADRQGWGEGRYLAANLDAALERNDRRQSGELATIAALFSLEILRPGENGEGPAIDALLKASSDNAVGVSGELRHGLQRSVEIIANEVLARLYETGLTPADIEDGTPLAKQLTRESLRYLYRILFLLYAEARPELGILPADDGTYEDGYSMARLRELVERDEEIVEEEGRGGFHLYESLAVLFAKVNFGHREYGTEPDDPQPGDDAETRAAKAARRSEDRGLRFEPLRSELFEPKAIRLIGRGVLDPRAEEDEPLWLDLRLRNAALHEVLRLLTMKKGGRRGERGGFISYRNLGINQLGAVYEGLMSYTGFIADEELCEVAKGGKPDNGSWMIPASRQDQYPDNVFVEYGEDDARKGLRGRKKYPLGSFVYRLAGRDRQTSASYYTPESLTKVTVELTLKHRLDQEKDVDGNVIKTRAAELLKYKICEPALGSGAFLNEAINQVAAEYLKRRQEELGRSIPTADALTELQKAKAYIALHNAYGVDLNATGVELAEVSLWLNTMHPGMQAPWFGLHLRRGNSLIGGRRAVYAAKDVVGKDWLKSSGALAPTELPFLKDGVRQALPEGAVHQFLLPAVGWAAVAGEKEAKNLAPKQTAQLGTWKKGILKPPSGKAPRGTLSQLARLQAVARRAEFLWELVVRRMEISEGEISRGIDVWGAELKDPEYAFLARPETAVPKEKVHADLFEATGTPYWRLKTLMDTWCALWFWPVDKAGLLDGSDEVYAAADGKLATAALAELPQVGEAVPAPAPAPVLPGLTDQTPLFSLGVDQESLFSAMDGDEVLSAAAPLKNTTAKSPKRPASARRAKIPLSDFADWLDFAEALLGAHDVPANSLIGQFESLGDVEVYEDILPGLMGMDPDWKLAERFPWLAVVRDVAVQQGFLNWELDFALVFAQGGGFDLQVGNPPWVQPRWIESAVLAEYEPWFMLTDKASTDEKSQRKNEVLRGGKVKDYVLGELTSTSAVSVLLGSPQLYPPLAGTQPDLYRAFMCQVWAHQAGAGTAGMVHPDTHLTGEKEAQLRESAYQRLRVHGDFVNAGQRFFPPPVGHATHFGVHVYGDRKEIGFDHLSWLVSTDALRLSASHDGTGDVPGIRYRNGEFDERPHYARVVRVDRERLAVWQRLINETDRPVESARLIFPVSTAEASAIASLADYPLRLADFSPQVSYGYSETSAKNDGLIDYNRTDGSTGQQYQPDRWHRVILKGPQLGVATPVFKRHDANSNDPYGLNLIDLPPDYVPDTAFVRVKENNRTYLAAQDRWVDHRVLTRLRVDGKAIARARAYIAKANDVNEDEVDFAQIDAALTARARRRYATFYRLAWRRQIAPDTERALYAALIPPGAVHVHLVSSLALPSTRHTSLVAGFWASLPLDYFLRVTGRSDLLITGAKAMPTPHPDHPLASALLFRTLRLNCLTRAYSDLWAELYDPDWPDSESWAREWPGLQPLHEVSPTWQPDTPLRTERARRSALVEIDALVAVWLGMDADALIAAYKGRFPVLQKYETVTWFDAEGWKLAGNARTIGQRQTKETWAQFEAHQADPENSPLPDGYAKPFYKADREREMREAHAVFQARLDAAVARGEWDPVKQEVPSR